MRPRVTDFGGRRVFLTGAGSGIGRAVALDLAAQGAHLFLTDINTDALERTANDAAAAGAASCWHRAADVSDHDAVAALAAAVHAEADAMDVVMNIAGIAAWGTVDRLEHRHWKSVIDVNLMGPVHVIEHFVPPMIRTGRGGYLVNVSSAAGLLGLPWHAAYSASKFGVRGVSEVLRFDLRRHGIGVSLVCPGGVATPLTESVQVAGADQSSPRFRRLQAHFRRRAVTPEQAASSILSGVGRGGYLVFTSRDIQLLYLLQRLFPPGYALAMSVANRTMTRLMPMSAP